MAKTIKTQDKQRFLNVIDSINDMLFTIDLTKDLLDDARGVKYKGDINGIVNACYKAYKSKDYNKGSLLFTMYLLRTNNWRMIRETMTNHNCFTYTIDHGAGYGHISGVCNTYAIDHDAAHDFIISVSNALNVA
jgi:hypothetical protein